MDGPFLERGMPSVLRIGHTPDGVQHIRGTTRGRGMGAAPGSRRRYRWLDSRIAHFVPKVIEGAVPQV